MAHIAQRYAKIEQFYFSVEIDALIDGVDFRTTMTRACFERLNLALFRKTIECVKSALADAKLEASQIDDVVLVGGSTRIPKVQRLLEELFAGKHLNRSINPDEAVAYGAAIQAAILSGVKSTRISDLLLVDVTPLTLGVELITGEMKSIVKRNTSIPAKGSGYIVTVADNQTSYWCKV